jgi:hypothetical protein
VTRFASAVMMAKMRVIAPSRPTESEMMISRREQEHYIRLHVVYLRCRRKVHCVHPRFLSRLPILRWKHTMYCFRLPQLPYLLERFCSRLRNDGMEVLNLNRDGKWQPRFLTVSSEVAFLATGAEDGPDDCAPCPKGLLWVKKCLAKSKDRSVINIDRHGKGCSFFSIHIRSGRNGRKCAFIVQETIARKGCVLSMVMAPLSRFLAFTACIVIFLCIM